jgi:hypothetical protein
MGEGSTSRRRQPALCAIERASSCRIRTHPGRTRSGRLAIARADHAETAALPWRKQQSAGPPTRRSLLVHSTRLVSGRSRACFWREACRPSFWLLSPPPRAVRCIWGRQRMSLVDRAKSRDRRQTRVAQTALAPEDAWRRGGGPAYPSCYVLTRVHWRDGRRVARLGRQEPSHRA